MELATGTWSRVTGSDPNISRLCPLHQVPVLKETESCQGDVKTEERFSVVGGPQDANAKHFGAHSVQRTKERLGIGQVTSHFKPQMFILENL